jgi:hypothetical protein
MRAAGEVKASGKVLNGKCVTLPGQLDCAEEAIAPGTFTR